MLIETNVQYATRYRQTDSNKDSFTEEETVAGGTLAGGTEAGGTAAGGTVAGGTVAGVAVDVPAELRSDAGVSTVTAHITH